LIQQYPDDGVAHLHLDPDGGRAVYRMYWAGWAAVFPPLRADILERPNEIAGAHHTPPLYQLEHTFFSLTLEHFSISLYAKLGDPQIHKFRESMDLNNLLDLRTFRKSDPICGFAICGPKYIPVLLTNIAYKDPINVVHNKKSFKNTVRLLAVVQYLVEICELAIYGSIIKIGDLRTVIPKIFTDLR
jgi:hypothetical protein